MQCCKCENERYDILLTRTTQTTSRILLTGASGLLGRELALRLARPGVRLAMWARNPAALTEIAAQCRVAGAEAEILTLDLTDTATALDALLTQDRTDPFDIALLAAGIGDTLPQGAVAEDPAQVVRLAVTNFVTPAAMASLLAGRMAERGGGRIALVGTAAASHSLPFAASYSGSKAGLARFADALRLAVKSRGISVTLISPGFFADGAALTRPGEIPVGIVADRMIAAMMAGKAELVLPRRFLLLRWLDLLFPRPLRDRILLSLRLP